MTTPARDWNTDATAALADALVSIEDRDDMLAVLRDLCTLRELQDLASRWQIAGLLADGLPQRQIADQVGTSTATVTRVNQWLQHGTGGYRLLLQARKDT